MSKAISILEVLEKAHAGKSMSAKRRKLIADSYGRALVMRNAKFLLNIGTYKLCQLIKKKFLKKKKI